MDARPFEEDLQRIRREIAQAVQQGIVSTIRSEADYLRLRGLAEETGHSSVSRWIARESVKQADALMRELGYVS